MRKVLSEIKECHLLNRYDSLSIGCVARPMCIIRESLRPYSLYYYILFRETDAGFLKGGYQTVIQNRTYLHTSNHFENGGNFHDLLKGCIDQNQYILLAYNLFYEEDHGYYNHFDHFHLCVLKGYDLDSQKYIIIDEDFTRKYWESCKDEMIYPEKEIDMEKLKRMAMKMEKTEVGLSGISNGLAIKDDVHFCYMRIGKDCEGVIPYDIRDINDLYIQQLKELINRAQEYEDAVIDGIAAYIRDFDRKYGDRTFRESLWSGDNGGLPMEIPKEINMFIRHILALESQKRMFSLQMEESELKNKVLDLFAAIIHNYSPADKNLRKAWYAGHTKGCSKIIDTYIKGSFAKEVELYERILELMERKGADILRYD